MSPTDGRRRPVMFTPEEIQNLRDALEWFPELVGDKVDALEDEIRGLADYDNEIAEEHEETIEEIRKLARSIERLTNRIDWGV